ncbi:hypothetical protein [Ramlibacter rhizophilus]|uniref:Cache domain-containing protein n=1 Tax=Ramlibacter rhizophilus TaxID=1781167 RepID=A0A4Z0BY80_9BURK|nr:hypothetical protein [Ramlibacter rhizophilus]TFZ03258.1 hypothetical protein EZ242_05045 [Ramlibacter rhizophilus]
MSADAGRFFQRYNRTIALAYGALLLAVAAFFAWQLQDTLRQELALVRGQVDRHHQFLEFLLRSAADQVETLRMAAGRPAASEAPARRSCPMPSTRLAQAGLREQGPGFDRDALQDRDAGANLVGEGSLGGRSAHFYCDLQAALALDSHLAAMAFHLPQAARVRFLSGQRFQLVAPWRPARELPFAGDLYDDPVWRLGQPAANPERLKYWVPVHFGGADAGLLATVAAPVFDRDRFMGVMAIDLSLDQLQRINAGFGHALGKIAVIDDSGKVLAHPGLYADPLAVRVPAGLRQLFEPDAIDSMDALLALPEGELVQRGGWTLLRRSFRAAPWQLVWAAPQEQLWRKLLAERAGTMGAVLLALAAIMLVTYAITRREFVGPAARLVEHLVAQARLAPRPIPRVPAAWRPWFEAITQAFRRSLELNALRAELDIAARLQQVHPSAPLAGRPALRALRHHHGGT